MRKWFESLERVIGHGTRVSVLIHIVGATVCAILACASYWLLNRPNDSSSVVIELPFAVEEAERLVASATMWGDELALETALQSQLLRDAETAVSWVPKKMDWRKTIGEMQNLAEDCDLVLVEMRPGDEFDGPRVAVHAAVCQLEGSYESVCRFLDGLTKREYPIWANELTLQNDTDGGPLTVVVHLRVPAAGKRSAIAYLIEKLSNDSSRNQETRTLAVDDVAMTVEGQYRGF